MLRPGSAHTTLRGVYAITDNQLQQGGALLTAVEQALRGGVRIIQYRNKQADFADRVAEARDLKNLCRQYSAPLLINDDVELCQAVDADGVHLGQSDTPVAEARYRLGPGAIIGVTCHNRPELVMQAERGGANYIAIGRFFPSQTKPMAPAASLQDLRTLRSQTRLPLVAIGGVTADNGSELLNAGANMLAVIHYLFGSTDIEARARALSQLFV